MDADCDRQSLRSTPVIPGNHTLGIGKRYKGLACAIWKLRNPKFSCGNRKSKKADGAVLTIRGPIV